MSEVIKPSRLPEIISLLKSKYPPVQSEEEAELLLTTEDLIFAISGLDPHFNYEKEDVFETLKNEGYRYEAVNENEKLVFKWLVGEC